MSDKHSGLERYLYKLTRLLYLLSSKRLKVALFIAMQRVESNCFSLFTRNLKIPSEVRRVAFCKQRASAANLTGSSAATMLDKMSTSLSLQIKCGEMSFNTLLIESLTLRKC